MSFAGTSILRRLSPRLLFAAVALVLLPAGGRAVAQHPVVKTRLADVPSSAVDVGPAPSSQRLSLTLTLAPGAARAAGLDQFLADVTTPSSPSYHQWLTPQQFAAAYGATPDQIAAATAWLSSQGLTVDAVSVSGTRISASGFVAQVETAFATTIHNFQIQGRIYHANTAYPQAAGQAAGLFAGIEGLDNLPVSSSPTTIDGQPSELSVAALASAVDANATAVLGLDASASTGAVSPSQLAGFSAVFRQAAAQGITTIVFEGAAGAFPADFPEVTAVAGPGAAASAEIPFAARPWWQNAAGLPLDGLRYAPDLTAASAAEFTQAVSSLALQSGGRLGNINAVVYELAPVAGVFTQTDGAAPGTWEPASGLGRVDTAAFVKAFPRGTGTSSLAISSSAGAPTHGQAFTLTVTSTSTSGGVVPTGTVTFSAPQAGFTGSTVTLNGSGVAQSPNYLIPGGTYQIAAAYSGDANYAPASSSITITVQPEAAVFTITAPASVSLGSTVTATVTLSSASGVGTPNASVTVTPSGITGAMSSTQTVAGTGGSASATYTFTTRQAGSVALQASCTSSDASFSCYTPQTSTTTVPQATPTVTLTATPATPTAGQQMTLSASVTGVAGIGTTGSVQFYDGTTSLGFGSAPTATYSGTLNTTGSHTLTAVYQGDSNYLKATSNAVATNVTTVPTTTVVSASAITASYGQSITLNIAVTGTSVVNGTQPTGTLTFTGAGTITSAPVSGGSANVTLNNLAVGTYSIGTSYGGDQYYAASTGNTVTLTVTQATASLNAQISSTSFTQGSTSTLTATVTLPGNAQLATGSTFVATIAGVTGAIYTGTFTVNVGGNTGTGAVMIPAPIAGSYTLQVTCGTNANFTCTPTSISITSTATSGGGGGGTGATGTTPSLTVLTYSPTGPAVGQSITLTATVSASATAVATTPIAGTVNFYDGTTLLGSGTIALVGTSAVATFKTTLTGTTTAHSLTAIYQGNTVYASSTSAVVTLTLAAAPASITLSSNVTSTLAGSSIVFTAVISGLTATGAAPTGTVSFYIAGTTPALFGTATVGTAGSGIGQAVFSTSNLPAGMETVYAVYNGDTNFGMATSNSLTIGLADYSVSFIPQTLVISQGTSASTAAVVTGVNSFSGTVTFGCTPPADYAMTCGFNPVVVTGNGSTTLTVMTTKAKSARLPGGGSSLGLAGGAALAGLLCLLLPGRGRRRVPGLLLVLFGLALTMNTGCSGTDFSAINAVNAGTPFGTTFLTITTEGTMNNINVRHNYTFQVTVQ